jgi:hypothetical protein
MFVQDAECYCPDCAPLQIDSLGYNLRELLERALNQCE